MTFSLIEQVEDYIKECLLQSTTFTLEEGHNVSTNIESQTGKYFYEKNAEPKIYHLIYANEGSEAGNYYNKFTLEFLEKAFQEITDLETFDVISSIKNRFIDISNEIFEKFDKNLTINDFNNDNKCIKLINHKKLSLKKCFIDELGFSNLKSNEFEPKYNYYKKGDKIIIKIESPGNIGPLTCSMYESVGYNKIIKIDGEKRNEKEPENKNDNIYNSREYGKYSIQFPIIYDDNYILKNQDPKIYDKKGIIFFEYQMEEKIKASKYSIESEDI
jgi:HSP20 family molecular chaperone IbpA